jgi:hypothetical protein
MEESTSTLKEWLQSSSVKFLLVCQQEKIEEMAVRHLINLAWQAMLCFFPSMFCCSMSFVVPFE